MNGCVRTRTIKSLSPFAGSLKTLSTVNYCDTYHASQSNYFVALTLDGLAEWCLALKLSNFNLATT